MLICGKVLITCRVKALIGENTVFHVGVSAQLVSVPLPTHARWVQVNLTLMYSKESVFISTLMFNIC